MYYFIGNTFGSTITGIEKAMINRYKIFNAHQMEACLIFLSWNSKTALYRQQHGIQNLYTMYDYFQGTIHINSGITFNYIKHWEEQFGYRIEVIEGSTDVRVYSDHQFIMYAHFLDKSFKVLGYINYFNSKRQKIKREYYDIRGFLSCTKYLYDNQVISEIYFDINQKPKIEKFYSIQDKKSILNHIILYDFKGRDYHFKDETSLIALFYESLYQPGDIFFSDRAVKTGPAFQLINSDIPVVAVLHSTHVNDNTDVANASIKSIYGSVFNNIGRYSAIVVSTKQQQEDVAKRINHQIPVVHIPVGYVNNIPESRAVPPGHHLVSVARLEPEKQLEQQIRLVQRLKTDITDIHLDFYGYGAERSALEQLVKQFKLEKHITFHGFTTDVLSRIQHANVSLITSHTEGFSLALLESLSQGIPCISYDINYGPREMIKDAYNGYLVNLNDEEELYLKTRTLLLDQHLQQSFINNSLQSVAAFSEEQVSAKWQNLLHLINK